MSDIKLAAQVIDAYSSGLDGLNADECKSLNIVDAQCATLQEVLKTGPEGEVILDERTKLASSGFSQDFIKTLAGDDGKKALISRVRWLADHAVKKWWRWDASEDDRIKMLQEIGRDGPVANEAVPALIETLENGDDRIQWQAAESLGGIGPSAKAAVPTLIWALEHGYRVMRREAAYAIGQIGPDAKDAVPELMMALRDNDPDVRRLTVDALGKIGPNAKDAVPALIPALRDHNFNVRRSAIDAIGKIGPDAKDAVPALIASCDDGSEYAVVVIAKIGNAVIPALLASLRDNKDGHRLYIVAKTLSSIGKDAVPTMLAGLNNDDPYIRKTVAEVLGGLGKDARIALSHLENLERNDPELACRKAAKYARERIEAEIL